MGDQAEWSGRTVEGGRRDDDDDDDDSTRKKEEPLAFILIPLCISLSAANSDQTPARLLLSEIEQTERHTSRILATPL